MFLVLVILLSLRAVSVIAYPHHNIVSTFAQRQTGVRTNGSNVTCAEFAALERQCIAPHCGCSIPYLQAQGNCLVSMANTSEDAALVQILLDEEMDQCHREGVKVDFQLQLPPAAAAILRKFRGKSEQLRRYQVSFLFLQIAGGHVGLVLVLLAAVFSRKVHRQPTFFNFCITWIFSSIVFSIMLYHGTQQNTILNPLGAVSPIMCLAQGALTNGVQSMTACSTLALVIELWFGLRTTIHSRRDVTRGPKTVQWTMAALLVAPYILFLGFTLPSVFFGERRIVFHDAFDGGSFPAVRPTHFYCTVVPKVAPSSFMRALYGVTLGLLLLTLCFDALIIHILYREWYAFRQLQSKCPVKFATLLRVMVFSIFRVVVSVAYGALLVNPPTLGATASSSRTTSPTFAVPVWIDILQGSIPLVACLTFGMNKAIAKDMMFTLLFWRDVEMEKTQHDVREVPAV